MDCRKTAAHKFRTRLRLKKYDIILTKEQPMLTKIRSSFERENMQIQYSVLGYRVDLYFDDYKLAAETDEDGHSDRNICYEIKRKKAIEQEAGCEFIKMYPGKEYFYVFEATNEIFKHIKQSSNQLTKQSTKKSLIDKISMKLLGLDFN